MQVAKWGNSLAIRIPVDVARSLGWQEGDEVDVAVGDARSAVLTRRMTREEAMASLDSTRVHLPEGWKMTREEMNARGPDAV